MQLIRMSYKDFTFYVNPDSLKLSHTKSVAKKSIPFGTGRVKEMTTNPVVISGKGAFGGDSARQSIRNMTILFNDKGSGYLFLPDSTPIRAIFNRFDVHYNGGDDRIEYSFEFVQEAGSKRSVYDFGYTYARSGENLYDIANRTNVSVGDLFDLNSYCDLFSVNEGDKVWLS